MRDNRAIVFDPKIFLSPFGILACRGEAFFANASPLRFLFPGHDELGPVFDPAVIVLRDDV